jgi:hypothetical protein
MTKKSGKLRNPTGTTGNYSSPRWGEKTKQTKVTPAKEGETKGSRQTKLSFRTAGNNISPPTPSGTMALKVITPGKHAGTNPIRHPSPPSNPESERPQTTCKHTPKNTTEDTTTKATTTKTPPPQNSTVTSNDDDKKPAARTSNTTFNDEFKEPATTTKTEQFTLVKKPPRRKKKVTTELTPPKHVKKDTPETPTLSNPEKPPTPQEPSKLSQNCGSIRYNGIIETPPSDKPFDEFLTLLAAYFQIIQDVLGKDVSLAAWDEEQTKAFPPLISYKKLPQSKESLGIYLGTYVNPKTEGSKVYFNLRLVTTKAHQVPLARFGMELADQFASSKHRMSIHRLPRACQAAKSECIGWLMYSCKSMNSNTFIPAMKKALNILDTVAIGIQFRSIANENGKTPAFDKENPPAAAIHLDMDKRYALAYQAWCVSLWRKHLKQRLPNDIQLPLVTCFTSATGKSMTDKEQSDAKTLLEGHFYFVKEHLPTLPPYFFISQLDTPLSEDNSMTLRLAMMSRAP